MISHDSNVTSQDRCSSSSRRLTEEERSHFFCIHVICSQFRYARIPVKRGVLNKNDIDWQKNDVTPQDRWRILNCIEMDLLRAVPFDYFENNRTAMTIVAYLLEKTMFHLASNASSYKDTWTITKRVQYFARYHASLLTTKRRRTSLVAISMAKHAKTTHSFPLEGQSIPSVRDNIENDPSILVYSKMKYASRAA